MGAKVFANGLEISGKASDVNTMGAMPDVCLSPPSPPAGPVPIPYPNFSQASDTTDGSKTVKIGGKEVGLKGKSSYKKSKGDEAATRSFGASVVSHTIQGSVKHQAGSMDVKVEGSNVCRFGDLTTGNHSNSGMPVVPGAGGPAVGEADAECAALETRNNDDRNTFQNNQALSGPGTTNTNFNFKSNTPEVSSMSKAAHSRVAARDLSPHKHVEGTPAQARLKKNNPKSHVACPGGSSFQYNGAYFKGGHTEARIIETIFKGSGVGSIAGTLTMKIDWQPSKGGQSCAPCEHCQALLCAAAKCGLKIEFCTNDNKKEALDKDNDCEDDLNMNDPAVRQNMEIKNDLLKRRLGG